MQAEPGTLYALFGSQFLMLGLQNKGTLRSIALDGRVVNWHTF